jgi:ribonuclease J
VVRANRKFKSILREFDPEQSIILYSLWDGYRIRPGSTIPDFLSFSKWESLHTSGHASLKDIRMVIEKTNPSQIIPIHTEQPEVLQQSCPNSKVVLLNDGEELVLI